MSKNKDWPSNHALEELLHAGEQEAQRRFGAEGFWDEHKLNAMFRTAIPLGLAHFIEALPFFFMATADAKGACDCSFRGREHDASGRPYPLLKVLDAQTLVFPDYAGNKLFNSLGNILVNPQIGMLFIDFETQTRVRVNGRAEIIEAQSAYTEIWPLGSVICRFIPSRSTATARPGYRGWRHCRHGTAICRTGERRAPISELRWTI